MTIKKKIKKSMVLDKEKITKLFNETGFPFQHWCLETIRNMDVDHKGYKFYAVSEYPFTFPPSNGPLLGVNGSIDILAVTAGTGLDKNSLLFLAFECKRANKNIKNWFFVSDHKYKKPLFVYSVVDDSFEEKRKLNRDLTFPNLGYSTIENFDYCYQAVETNDNLVTLNRNQEEKIYKGLKQINHGMYALENKTSKHIIEGLTADISLSMFRYFIFIPILVTTANLYLAEFNYKDIRDGDILKEKIKYKKKKWLTYEFPLPDFISHRGNIINKRTTFIVNDQSFVEFLNNIKFIRAYGLT